MNRWKKTLSKLWVFISVLWILGVDLYYDIQYWYSFDGNSDAILLISFLPPIIMGMLGKFIIIFYGKVKEKSMGIT